MEGHDQNLATETLSLAAELCPTGSLKDSHFWLWAATWSPHNDHTAPWEWLPDPPAPLKWIGIGNGLKKIFIFLNVVCFVDLRIPNVLSPSIIITD